MGECFLGVGGSTHTANHSANYIKKVGITFHAISPNRCNFLDCNTDSYKTIGLTYKLINMNICISY